MTITTQLFAAFSSRPRPAAGQIVRPDSDLAGRHVSDELDTKSVEQLSPDDVNDVIEGYVWALSPTAMLYYLPALMDAALNHYQTVSVFASELIGALTKPARADVIEAIDRFEYESPIELRDPGTAARLREQQLEWFDSGVPSAVFRERFEHVTVAEGAAVLMFLEAFAAEHGDHFPFGEVSTAIDRYWSTFRDAGAGD